MLGGAPASAQDPGARDPVTTPKRERVLTYARERDGLALTLYTGGLVDGGLLRTFVEAFRWTFVGSQMVSLIVAKPFGQWDMRIGRSRLLGWWFEGEAQIAQHFGVEDHTEATVALMVRSGEIRLGRHASFNIGVSNGFSWAFSKPKWELGPTRQRGVDAPQLLWFVGIEAEFSSPRWKGLSAVARIHHRSENYGALGPPWYTSNRVGVGLRYRFE